MKITNYQIAENKLLKGLGIILAGLLISLALANPALATSEPKQSPQEVVEEGVAALSAILSDAQAIYKENPEDLYRQIDTAMSPFVDFRYMSAKVMGGAYFRAATAKQRREFADVFQATLVKTFAKGLVTFDYKEFNFLPARNESRYDNQDQVHLEIVAMDNKRYPVTFMLRLANNEWKLVNLIVNGINLGLTFNSQFEEAMRTHKRNFDAVIKNWNPEAAIKEVEEGQDAR